MLLWISNLENNSNMKKLMMICAMLFSVITFAHAQGGGQTRTPEERAQRTMDQLTEKLKLTEDQKPKVMAVLVDQNVQMNKAREEANGDRDAMRTTFTKIQANSQVKVNALLTDEQKKAYASWQEERKAAMQNRGGGMGGPSANK
jgi:protein CpxP